MYLLRFDIRTAMKVFKYKFTKLITTLIYAAIPMPVLVLGLTTYHLIVNDISTAVNIVYPILQYSLMYLVAILLGIILISLLVSSYYSIDGKVFKTSFGIIKSKYDAEKIESVILDRTTNKLAVYFNENTFMVIVVKEEWYDDFIKTLTSLNERIEFDFTTPDDKRGGKKKN